MVKSIAIDMDGTLVNKKQSVSKENKEAIEKAISQGIEVIIATGRSFEEARYALDEVDIKTPIIGINGAVVIDTEGKVVEANTMSYESVTQAAHILNKHDLYYEIYSDQGTYTQDKDKSIALLVDIFLTSNPGADPLVVTEEARKRFEVSQIKIVDSYQRLFEKPEIQYYKFLVFSVDFKKLGEAASELKKLGTLAVTSSGRDNLEINALDAQKGVALEKYLTKRGISMSDAMAIGDNYNDVSMFERVGRAVAMGNAPADIQRICHFVTDTNNENGVAKAILKVLED
ncbi:Cof subfamily protein (haloacid dehalogenase superfamily) [Peribacillus deserti]|uniref:Cof subfamily protein (Haloacid dehalogenase superfamily) n=1 Tax=Peribacillus deserti TaxID=673318 RepID=A0ABS2QCA7_9BACI|nr:Cof-type HAD-IIB family hydrolase [Peribacillus deserti]MBM7690610.1 Cof subfamily protein (haloacid dehalogenase superfamily) [Peribacillus deserti]